MDSWHALTLGKYDPQNRYIGLDFRRLFLDPLKAHATMAHESSHAVMSNYDFGQAARNIFNVLSHAEHLTEEQKEAIRRALMEEQFFVQEGLATFMEIGHLAYTKGNSFALDWAEKHLNPDYKKRFDQVRHAAECPPAFAPTFDVFALSNRYRGSYIAKLGEIALETGLRQDLVEQDLLRDGSRLVEYLQQPENNPNARLWALMKVIRCKPWLLIKSTEEIARAAGVRFRPFATSQQVADFLTYITSFTRNPRKFLASDIKETGTGEQQFLEAMESAVIGNINLDLHLTAEKLRDPADLLHYADVIDVVFVSQTIILHHTGQIPIIHLLAFRKTGEKYIIHLPREEAIEILNTNLKNATMLIKQGGFDLNANQGTVSPALRHPEIVLYNRPQDLNVPLADFVTRNPAAAFSYGYMGATADHPFQTIIVKVADQYPLHIANGFWNKHIDQVIDTMGVGAIAMKRADMGALSRPINDFLSVMGLPWDIDWVKTMLDGTQVFNR